MDGDGQAATADSISGQWHHRVIDLSSQAGKTVDYLYFITDGETAPGAWSVDYRDFVYLGADGTVTAIYRVGDGTNLNPGGTDGQSAMANVAETGSPYPGGVGPVRYYLDDHLGTAQVEMGLGGWPTWMGQFTPFGQELDNGLTAMHYKFTGKERDAESGLDYFGARYYASSLGRWMSPDWADKPEAVPYSSLDNPQSLNLYGYVGNNPLSKADPDGHCCQALDDFMSGAGGAVGHDNSLGLHAEDTPDSTSGRAGAFFGHLIAAGQGALEVLGAAGGEVGGTLLDATGVGALIGVPINVGAAAVGVHGSATAGTAIVAMGRGSYTNTHESGKTYSGKGDSGRAKDSAKEKEIEHKDKHVATDHSTAANDRESFKDESRRIDAQGGPGSTNNYNKIESPGKNYRKQDGSH